MQYAPLPDYVLQYFWGGDLSELSLQKHQNYIIQTILNIGDARAASWLLHQFGKEEIRERLPVLKLDPKSATFWRLYLS